MNMLKLLSIAVPALALAPNSALAATILAPAQPSKLSMFSSIEDSSYLSRAEAKYATHKFAKGVFETPDGPTSMPIILVPLAAVPEPAAWGMLIAGVGFAGVVLRRRRRATLAYA